ncbi:ABC transporter permease [Luteimonas yindakuii]|uniref:ABC transporter permease n=1 Tax=Luteimonas yindakuii TaxID=2565782 RepID=A0A4Z1R017_9GAMM|nr:ABC transporter permease [Luteimonas yindakuii]QCO66903.1 ABC transporter permease [Luteimonas yindakuii]TKS52974.1 ABC transporter permease [Luteimonas yindakuii]
MNTIATSTPTPVVARAPAVRACLVELRCELLKLLREPAYVLPAVLFPVLFYLLFGVMLSGMGAPPAFLLAGYGVFGTIGATLFGVGVGVANEREQGLLRLRRALPAHPLGWLLARTLAAMGFSLAITALLAIVGSTLGGVSLPMSGWALLFVVNLSGVLPFAALGFLIGSLVGGNAAIAVVNMLFLPMVFLSGLWLPLTMLPDFFARLAPVWPAYHLGQIAFKVVGHDAGGALWLHLLALLVPALVFAHFAWRRLSSR